MSDADGIETTPQERQQWHIRADDAGRLARDFVRFAVEHQRLAARIAALVSEREKVRGEALEEAAKVAELMPDVVLQFWDRPGGPPGNGYRRSTFTDIATSIRALSPAPASVAREGGEDAPVAWRVKDFADGWTLHHTEAAAQHESAMTADSFIQPLYARPAKRNSGDERQANGGFARIYLIAQRKTWNHDTTDWQELGWERFDYVECGVYAKPTASLTDADRQMVEYYGKPSEEFVFPSRLVEPGHMKEPNQ